MFRFRQAIWDIVYDNKPMSARQVYYRAVVAGLIDKDVGKSRANEQKVGNALNLMRENGIDHYVSLPGPGLVSEELDEAFTYELGQFRKPEDETSEDEDSLAWDRAQRRLLILPFAWITDNTRTRFQAKQYIDREAALKAWQQQYRRDLWQRQPRHIEVWCESDSIAGVIGLITREYGLALLPCRGQSSKPFIFNSTQEYAGTGKPVTCLYIGDFDPAGLDIGKPVETRLARYGAPDVEFRRLAITPEQVRDLGLPGHGLNANTAEPVLKRFTDVCDEYGLAYEAVEAEALPPNDLRQLLRDTIEEYIDPRQWELEKAVEDQERLDLKAMLRDQAG